jgi:hypothetical protein
MAAARQRSAQSNSFLNRIHPRVIMVIVSVAAVSSIVVSALGSAMGMRELIQAACSLGASAMVLTASWKLPSNLAWESLLKSRLFALAVLVAFVGLTVSYLP